MAEKLIKSGPACLDLFCGIGGLTVGLEQSGFFTIGGVDHWKTQK